jgi:hypothetical protein
LLVLVGLSAGIAWSRVDDPPLVLCGTGAMPIGESAESQAAADTRACEGRVDHDQLVTNVNRWFWSGTAVIALFTAAGLGVRAHWSSRVGSEGGTATRV